jgi:hypothetical protein
MAARYNKLPVVFVTCLVLSPAPVAARATEGLAFGVRASAGGRYDDIRKCVATSPGTKGGPAMDISLVAFLPFTDELTFMFNLPVMRPLLFAFAFRMLQFEPEASLLMSLGQTGPVDWLAGPLFGLVFHYGPDFRSEADGQNRRPDFFAWGPKLGGHVGISLGDGRFRVGVTPYWAPLAAVGDRKNHHGNVIGGSLDGVMVF